MNSGEPMYPHRKSSIKPIDGKIRRDNIHRQSDCFIVSKKSRNGDGEKGAAVMQRDTRDTSAGRRTGEQVGTKLMSLTLRARGKSEM